MDMSNMSYKVLQLTIKTVAKGSKMNNLLLLLTLLYPVSN